MAGLRALSVVVLTVLTVDLLGSDPHAVLTHTRLHPSRLRPNLKTVSVGFGAVAHLPLGRPKANHLDAELPTQNLSF